QRRRRTCRPCPPSRAAESIVCHRTIPLPPANSASAPYPASRGTAVVLGRVRIASLITFTSAFWCACEKRHPPGAVPADAGYRRRRRAGDCNATAGLPEPCWDVAGATVLARSCLACHAAAHCPRSVHARSSPARGRLEDGLVSKGDSLGWFGTRRSGPTGFAR